MAIPKEERLSELRKAISSLEAGLVQHWESDPLQSSGSDCLCAEKAASSFDDEESISKVLEKGPREAYQRVIKLISIKERPISYVREKLASEGFPEDAVEYAVHRAIEFGLLDDVRYAEALFRTRYRAGKGRRGINQELLKLGISPDCIDEDIIVSEIGDADELDRALALLDKHPPRCKNIRDGAFRKLYQKGFSSDISSRAAGIWASRLCS